MVGRTILVLVPGLRTVSLPTHCCYTAHQDTARLFTHAHTFPRYL